MPLLIHNMGDGASLVLHLLIGGHACQVLVVLANNQAAASSSIVCQVFISIQATQEEEPGMHGNVDLGLDGLTSPMCRHVHCPLAVYRFRAAAAPLPPPSQSKRHI